jgi:hypothetical protein
MESPKFQVYLKKPHDAQLEVLRSPAKRKIVRAGRRAGKTTGIAILAIEKFLQGRRVLYAVPTADQCEAFWREVKLALGEAVDAGIFKMNMTERFVELEGTNQRIRAKTAWNADSLRGDYADVLILDEFQLMNEDAWEFVGAPMLLDNDGDAVFIYTPPSMHSRAITKARDPRHAAKMFKRAQTDKSGRWAAFHFSSHANPYISRDALGEIERDMTQLAYRQEILAEDVDQIPGALWTQALLDLTRIARDVLPPMDRIVIGVDPSGSSRTEAGIVAAGIDRKGERYIIADRSLLAPTPEAWGSAAVKLYHELRADRVIGERNFGGDMIAAIVRAIDANVSYRDTVSSRGKIIRAEPCAAAFERGVAHLAGEYPALESEMCNYTEGDPSPNRLDAAVFALAELGSSGELGCIEFYKGIDDGTIADPTLPVIPATLVDTSKPKVEQETLTCPSCSATCVSRLSTIEFRCNQCALQFFKDGPVSQIQRGPTRSDFLAGRVGRQNKFF